MKKVLPLYADLPTPAEMQQWDHAAESLFGIPPVLLMENAAQAALRELRQRIHLGAETNILIFMGKGNNGGDGAALARLLHDDGCNVLVCCIDATDAMSGAAGKHLAMARKIGVNFLPAETEGIPLLPIEWSRPHVVIDAIAGTGLRGELRPKTLAFVRSINALRDTSFILALDIPSGLCGYTGKPRPEAVRAHATVTFEAGKPGLFFPEARDYTGEIAVHRVGIPQAVRTTVLPSWKLLQPETNNWPLPPVTRHKGEAGKVLIIGGSEGMAGAPVLAALGSLRAGAGLVHLLVPADLADACRAGWPELLLRTAGNGSLWTREDTTEILECIEDIQPDALVIGPGMGRSSAVRDIVHAILEDSDRPPAVVDADALFFLQIPHADEALEATGAGQQAPRFSLPALSPALLRPEDIITPHPGEMARILPLSFFPDSEEYTGRPLSLRSRTEHVQRDRTGALELCLAHCAAVVVLKGAGTLVGRRGAPVALSPFAVPSLGVGGSGDVLAGICAALVAQGLSSPDAACFGVYLHGRAGELLASRAPVGHMAREIADAVIPAWSELCAR